LTEAAQTSARPAAAPSVAERDVTRLPVVRLTDVRKRHAGGVESVRGASFAIESGEMVFLTGPSGAGKTTLLRLIAGIELPTSGRVEVCGQDVARLSRVGIAYLRRRLGLVLQDQHLLANRTVLDNILLPLTIAGFARREAAGRARAALDKVGLLEREKAFPGVLSAGELQRACIARAVVARPNLLVADEPTANVDPDYATQIFELFRDFNRVGVTVLVASHDLRMVDRFASRVLRVRAGEVGP